MAFDFFQGILSGCLQTPLPIAAVLLGILPPYSLVLCRRTVWYIATVYFVKLPPEDLVLISPSPPQRHW